MFPVYGVEDAHPGARASRPHNVRHGLGPLRHSDRPGTAASVAISGLILIAVGGICHRMVGLSITT